MRNTLCTQLFLTLGTDRWVHHLNALKVNDMWALCPISFKFMTSVQWLLQVWNYAFKNLQSLSPWSFNKSFRTFKILQLPFWETSEFSGEKQTWTSAQFNLNWISEFFQNPQKFSSPYIRIGSVFYQTPINKVEALTLICKFSFGQNLSSVQNSSERSSGKSVKLKS